MAFYVHYNCGCVVRMPEILEEEENGGGAYACALKFTCSGTLEVHILGVEEATPLVLQAPV